MIIRKDILCVGGIYSNGFYLIEILTHQIIKNITGKEYIVLINVLMDYYVHLLMIKINII